MPSTVKSKSWFIRVTAPWEHIISKLDTLKGKVWYEGMMVGFHHGDKQGAPHAHICLKTTYELQKQSIDVAVKQVFGLSSRSTYSSKPWDGNKAAMSYLYHDTKGIVENYLGLTEDEVNGLRRDCITIQAAVKTAKERASHKVIDYLIAKHKDHWDRYDIGRELLLAVSRGEFHHPGPFMVERYILEVELRMANEHEVNRVIDGQLRLLKMFN